MMGRPIPNINGLVKPIFNQFLLALALGFGQFFVGGLVVKYFLPPSMDANPLMGCLIEVGFEGGHGAASIIGESFNKLGFQNGLDLGLAMATMGLLSSSILGSIFIFLGRTFGLSDKEEILEQKESLKEKKIEILYELRKPETFSQFLVDLRLDGKYKIDAKFQIEPGESLVLD